MGCRPRLHPCHVANSGGRGGQGRADRVVRAQGAQRLSHGRSGRPCWGEGVGTPFPRPARLRRQEPGRDPRQRFLAPPVGSSPTGRDRSRARGAKRLEPRCRAQRGRRRQFVCSYRKTRVFRHPGPTDYKKPLDQVESIGNPIGNLPIGNGQVSTGFRRRWRPR